MYAFIGASRELCPDDVQDKQKKGLTFFGIIKVLVWHAMFYNPK